jgi:hypothetical protein
VAVGASRAAPMTSTTMLLVVGPGRTPIVTCGPAPDDLGDHRLSMEVLGAGHGVTVTLRGPLPILRAVVADLASALEQARAVDHDG